MAMKLINVPSDPPAPRLPDGWPEPPPLPAVPAPFEPAPSREPEVVPPYPEIEPQPMERHSPE